MLDALDVLGRNESGVGVMMELPEHREREEGRVGGWTEGGREKGQKVVSAAAAAPWGKKGGRQV